MPISQETKDKLISFVKEFFKDKELPDEAKNQLENLNEESLNKFKESLSEEQRAELKEKLQEKLQGTGVTLDDIKEVLASKTECQTK